MNSSKWQDELVLVAEKYIREITTRKEHFIIRQSSPYRIEVEGHLERQEVDKEHRQCSCRYWQATRLSCIYAVAFIGTKEHMLWHIYVDNYYHVIRYSMAYEGAISTLPRKDQWTIIDYGV